MRHQICAELYNYISPSGPLTLQEIAVASSGDNSHLWINDISTVATYYQSSSDLKLTAAFLFLWSLPDHIFYH